jgi:hypothetical protein
MKMCLNETYNKAHIDKNCLHFLFRMIWN